ncbi:hypothetical protein [Cupriavidus cauae]|uniref:Uncharacterized protein n=1 Tax=Cupriavidus cauae TaxID=2608999 RepID=A0A5M8AVV9_9BURK|nr:hypothetical protein [Cupriavidus cauae]KAA6127968.1 hypothetical protein F1599_07215 [Cupriavidus cauae]
MAENLRVRSGISKGWIMPNRYITRLFRGSSGPAILRRLMLPGLAAGIAARIRNTEDGGGGLEFNRPAVARMPANRAVPAPSAWPRTRDGAILPRSAPRSQ